MSEATLSCSVYSDSSDSSDSDRMVGVREMATAVMMPAAAETEELSAALKELESDSELRLVLGSGTELTLPEAAASAVRQVIEALAQGKAVAVVPYSEDLTTQQAADLLGMSRQHLVDLLDEGEIPHYRVGTHRRVNLKDVLDFRERRREHRRERLDDLTRLSQESDPTGYH